MKATDLTRFRYVGVPTITPDASRLVTAVMWSDLATDSQVSVLREFTPSGSDGNGSGRLLTRGPADSAPQYAPDGTKLAFLRPGPAQLDGTKLADAPQLQLLDARGGEATVITDLPLGVTAYQWLPDSSGIVCQAAIPAPGRYRPDLPAEAEAPRMLPGFQGRANGRGYVFDRPHQLFYLPVGEVHDDPIFAPVGRAALVSDSAERFGISLPRVRQLTCGDHGFSLVNLTLDGEYALAMARRHENCDSDLRADLFAIRIACADESEPPIALTTSGDDGEILAWNEACELPEGLYLASSSLGTTGVDFIGQSKVISRLSSDDFQQLLTGKQRALTPGDSRLSYLTDPTRVRPVGPLIPGPDSTLCFGIEERGSLRLAALTADGELSCQTESGRVVTGWAPSAEGIIALSYADAATAGEVATLQFGDCHRHSDLGRTLRDSGLIRPQERCYPSRDEYPVHGWVLLPEDPVGAPTILLIHGGPHSAYTPAVFDEAQVLVAAGYAVVMCNPRGSSGYGRDHARVVRRALGTVDADDVLAFLAGALAEFDQLDPERLGIMGGSYGGYLTAWVIAHDHRFRGAIIERGYLDPAAFVGSSDIGWFFSGEYVGSDPDEIAAASPFAQVSAVRTPSLVIHSEQDLRCPLEQALRYYTALKVTGVPVDCLIFPGENHELSRSGRPWHRLDRFAAILDFWGRWLPPQSSG